MFGFWSCLPWLCLASVLFRAISVCLNYLLSATLPQLCPNPEVHHHEWVWDVCTCPKHDPMLCWRQHALSLSVSVSLWVSLSLCLSVSLSLSALQPTEEEEEAISSSLTRKLQGISCVTDRSWTLYRPHSSLRQIFTTETKIHHWDKHLPLRQTFTLRHETNIRHSHIRHWEKHSQLDKHSPFRQTFTTETNIHHSDMRQTFATWQIFTTQTWDKHSPHRQTFFTETNIHHSNKHSSLRQTEIRQWCSD